MVSCCNLHPRNRSHSVRCVWCAQIHPTFVGSSFLVPSPPHAMSPSPPQPAILDLRATFKSSLVHDLVTGLTNETRTVPGERDEDQAFAYTRHISTLVLYSDEGLRIYEDITKLDAYYPFNAELEILERDGDEIVSLRPRYPTSRSGHPVDQIWMGCSHRLRGCLVFLLPL